ncbi:MAG: acylphosphatase [Proteobacteria bacterium]|nr:acylphosphatase [Pseudomonadota bacterium]
MTICKRCLVSGKVQGVFYRAATRKRAQSLRVTGYAKNLPDGRVEVLACGAEDDVHALVEWLREGPPAARVESVETESIDTDPPVDFTSL